MTDKELLQKYKKAYHQSIDDIRVLNKKLAEIEEHFRYRYQITGSERSLNDLNAIKEIKQEVR